MYLYLSEENNFSEVPEALMQKFGLPQRVMELELHAKRKLSRANTAQVIKQLQTEGYYLQLPPKLQPHLYHGNEA